MGISFHRESESVFVDPVGVEVAFGFFPMTATNAEQGLIVGIVECSLAGIDFGLAVGLGAPGRIPGGDPLWGSGSIRGRVTPGDCSPEVPTDPDMRNCRIRLFSTRFRYVAGERMRGCGS